ncbi:MAG: hypothetical protein GX922_01310 [Firmicutes bacterium]|nr:hypothetical protein [Bacillota bacterium]
MSIQTYRQLCQKNDAENYLLDKLIFRKISIFITILFIKVGITANQTTFLSLVASLASLYFLTFNTRTALIIAAGLIFSYYILDHVDGELARYAVQTGKSKPNVKGHYFDVLVHRYSSNLMVFFMSLGIYNQYGYKWAVLLGFLGCIGISSFPNVVAAQVIAGKIARQKEAVFTDPALIKILAELEKKQLQIQAVHHGSLFDKSLKLLIESLFFPGHIILLILTLLIDAFWPGFPTFNLRCVFLVSFTLLYTVKTLMQSILWLIKLKQIS